MLRLNKDVSPEDAEIDTTLWRVVLDDDGFPMAALYYNGRRHSLPQAAMEDLEGLVRLWSLGAYGTKNGLERVLEGAAEDRKSLANKVEQLQAEVETYREFIIKQTMGV